MLMQLNRVHWSRSHWKAHAVMQQPASERSGNHYEPRVFYCIWGFIGISDGLSVKHTGGKASGHQVPLNM